MAPKHAGGATIKGKQASVQEGQFLQFLRSVGYKDELPPSTVAWLETAPVFRFLASKLSHDNFITAEDQQEYNELMLARGPDASLYDAVEGYSSDADDDSCAAASTKGHKENDPFLVELPDDEVCRLLQEEEAYSQQLEQQIAMLRAASGTLEATNRQQAENQGPMYFGLTAQAANEFSAVKLDAQQLADTLDSLLKDLEGVCAELCSITNQPQLWLLCAADQSGYRQVDDQINTQHKRGVQVLDVCDVALDLHHPASPTGMSPLALAAVTAAGDSSKAGALQPQGTAAAATGGGSMTPRGQQQQQQQPLTPRQHMQAHSLASALAEAKEKRRAAHAARNLALNREMGRQQHAFLLSHQRELKAALQEQGLKAQLAAAHQVRSRNGDFAAVLGKGPLAVQELSRHMMDLEAAKQLLLQSSVKPLLTQVAQHNDCHIVVGDYDRHLAKVNYAMDHKRAMLDGLLRRASLHLLLLLLGTEELRRLASLCGDLQGTAHLLEGHVMATEARVQRCGAALEALDKAQGRNNLQANDSYLCAMLAAAEGSLVLPEQQQQRQATAATAHQDPHTPHGALSHAGKSSLGGVGGDGGMFTPSYAPTSNIVDKLQSLSASLDSSIEQLHKLLDLLPAQLDQHKATACRLHRTAFPPGQVVVHGAGGSSSIAGSVAGPGSTAGSTWGAGSQSAAASVRSMHSAGSGTTSSAAGGTQHLQPQLTLPEVAEATAALKACLEQLTADTNRAVLKQNETVKTMTRSKEKQLERRVMGLFFTAPEELSAEVDNVKAQVQRMQLDQALSFEDESSYKQ